MKTLILIFALVLTATSCCAASCSDTQNAATEAIKERNAKVKETHNTTMPDPKHDNNPTKSHIVLII